MSTAGTDVPPPVIRVERGRPTPEQLAALVVVLTAATGSGEAGGPSRLPRTMWTERSRFARPRPAVGAGGWRASSLPR